MRRRAKWIMFFGGGLALTGLGVVFGTVGENRAAGTRNESVGPAAVLEPSELARAWATRLRGARSVNVNATCVRECFRTAEGTDEDSWESIKRIELLANAEMGVGTHHLSVWENADSRAVEGDQPVLIIDFRDGVITQRLWYPTLGAFRLTEYEAPTPFGANDCEYEESCQIGTLLQSWVGQSEMAAYFLDVARASEPLSDPIDVDGVACRGFATHAAPYKDPITGATTYERSDMYLFDSRNTLREWRTTVLNRMRENGLNGVPVRIVQRRTYAFSFVASVGMPE